MMNKGCEGEGVRSEVTIIIVIGGVLRGSDNFFFLFLRGTKESLKRRTGKRKDVVNQYAS